MSLLRRLLLLFLSVDGIVAAMGQLQGSLIRYVAIGDSCTIGEGASPNESWPAVLTRHLQEKGLPIELVANPAVTGWTTQQAIDRWSLRTGYTRPAGNMRDGRK